jgi:molybdopterin synthase catalytic subunit
MSGMSEMIVITEQPLNPEQITDRVRQDSNGAVVTFLGTTRDSFEGKRVVHLEYEAYEEMAYKKLEEIRQELRVEFGVEDVAIAHRIGPVDIGHISLVVAVASPHRKEAFLACHEAVNRLKQIVPIWKKEVFEDGAHWVACEDHEFSSAEVEAEVGVANADND